MTPENMRGAINVRPIEHEEPETVAIPQVQGWSAIGFAALLLHGWAFPSVWRRGLHERLVGALEMELAVLGSMFLVLLLLGAKSDIRQRSDKIIYWTYVVGYLLLLGGLAVAIGGASAGAEGAVLIFITYGPLLWMGASRAVVTIYLIRFLFSFLLLFLLIVVIIGGAQALVGRIAYVNLLTGAVFFATLGTLDVLDAFNRFVQRRLSVEALRPRSRLDHACRGGRR